MAIKPRRIRAKFLTLRMESKKTIRMVYPAEEVKNIILLHFQSNYSKQIFQLGLDKAEASASALCSFEGEFEGIEVKLELNIIEEKDHEKE